jgi:hypothetical protein
MLIFCLISVAFLPAKPFSVEFTFSSGAMRLSTNGVFYGGNNAFDDAVSYWETSLKFELVGIYKKLYQH